MAKCVLKICHEELYEEGDFVVQAPLHDQRVDEASEQICKACLSQRIANFLSSGRKS